MTTPYRDDVESLKARLAALTEELGVVQGRARELAELQRIEERLVAEVEELRFKLERMSARRSLPLLESLRVASPCTADWNKMVGDDRVRFCGDCEKDVYNLSGMSRTEAERFVRERATDVCVRLYQRADGTVLTSDCPVGVKRVRRRKAAAAAISGGLLAAGALLGTEVALDATPLLQARTMPRSPAPTIAVEPAPAATPADPGDRVVMGKIPVRRFAPTGSANVGRLGF